VLDQAAPKHTEAFFSQSRTTKENQEDGGDED